MNFNGTIKVHGCRLLLGVISALAVAWMFEPVLISSWIFRLLMLGGLLVVISGLFHMEVKKQLSAERTAKRYMDMLCQLDRHELGNAPAIDALPPLDRDNPWRPMFDRVRDRLVDCGQRADEAEHARTATEVRARRLENECARIKEILDRISDSIMSINQYDEIVWANEPARNLFGLNVTADAPAKLTEIPCKALVDLLIEARRRKVGSNRTGEIELVDRSGQQHWFRVVCRALSQAGGEQPGQHGALAVLTDISQEKGIQKRHAEFVAAASHEMKTPLSSIRAYVELLQDGEAQEPDVRDEFLDVIQNQSERLQRLIENLLNLARIEAGVVKVDKQQLSLNEVLEQAFSVVQPTAEQKPIELLRDLSPMYLGVLGDHDMILQATINLLSNAVKYTPAGGKVVLRSRMEENAAMLEVEDSGVGLSPEDCHKIFEKFYRVKKDQQMAPGTGLGLPLVKHIVEDVHGGTITVKSQPGVGSIFRVTLPVVGRGKD
jgi:two-component system phosphate regulon sensor histidine kinase PhoR